MTATNRRFHLFPVTLGLQGDLGHDLLSESPCLPKQNAQCPNLFHELIMDPPNWISFWKKVFGTSKQLWAACSQGLPFSTFLFPTMYCFGKAYGRVCNVGCCHKSCASLLGLAMLLWEVITSTLLLHILPIAYITRTMWKADIRTCDNHILKVAQTISCFSKKCSPVPCHICPLVSKTRLYNGLGFNVEGEALT